MKSLQINQFYFRLFQDIIFKVHAKEIIFEQKKSATIFNVAGFHEICKQYHS